MKKHYLFWVTGLPGSGKTAIAKKIYKSIHKKYGPTIELSGDNLRKYFFFNKYDIISRKIYAKKYSEFCKLLTTKGFNVIFSTVSLFHEVQMWNRKNIRGYYEIYIKSDVKKIIKLDKKKIYRTNKNLVGINLKPEFPKNPDFQINNNFKIDIKILSNLILKNIYKNCK